VCQTCPVGTFSVSNSGGCKTCSFGQYSSNNGSTSCIDCPVNFYADQQGMSSCTECPKPTFTVSSGSSSISDCKIQKCSDWSQVNDTAGDSHYFASMDQPRKFWTAPDYCHSQKHGAHLPKPNDLELQTVVLSQNSWWAGVYGLGMQPGQSPNFSTAQFFWSDGSQISSANVNLTSIIPQSCQWTANSVFCIKYDTPAGSCGTCDAVQDAGRSFSCQIDDEYCGLFCNPGEFFDIRSNPPYTCQNCSRGQFQLEYGASSCYECTSGLFSSNVGSSACSQCPPGLFSASTGTRQCSTCGAGRFTINFGASACDNCPAGKYSLEGNLTCMNCPNGTFSASGDSTCQLCSLGRYSNDSNSKISCNPCPTGRFVNITGASNCLECRELTDTLYEASTSISDCLCQAGYFGDVSIEPCSPCLNSVAVTCPKGSVIPHIAPGYYRLGRSGQQSNVIYSCSPFEACAKTENQTTTTCGRGYTGYVCGDCAQDFYRYSGACKDCPSAASKYMTMIGAAILFLGLTWRLMNQRTQIPVDVRVTLQALQILALFPNITVKWPKYILTIFQIYSVLVRLDLRYFVLIFSQNINIELFSPECAFKATFWTKYFAKLLFPLVIAAFVILLLLLRMILMKKYPALSRFLKGNDLSITLFEKVLSLFSFLLVAFYTLLISTVLQPFNCTRQPDNSYTLTKSPSLGCYDSKWNQNLPFVVIFIILYGFGIPSFILWIFYSNRHKIRTFEFMRKFSSLIAPYRPKLYYFELCVMLKRALFVISNDFLAQQIYIVRYTSSLSILFFFAWLNVILSPYRNKNYNLLASS
jgi:hypothetical protein